MSNDNELADSEILGIPEAIREIWDHLTTSQKLQAITPDMAKAYRLEKENQKHLQDLTAIVNEIKRMKLEEKQERQKNDPWKFLRNVAKYIVGEIDKR